ncbi:WhiB family transcriptional regulator [Mycolicibacterium psychrotolerans]|uniref:4Fe-4S Wbl-type domain-containing protein n=1 Tax=Mycolicibacterium psychrotolerans TaxID=216929 RepID=A0A7I7MCU6_9MYCO|nr:WhiB family transcriptional regulator [Mycolicibacterium psychrotolerans]BBX70094.1 hypothetical protein MPSYJ_35550 [Mycolicibacterium psychrotolerans]
MTARRSGSWRHSGPVFDNAPCAGRWQLFDLVADDPTATEAEAEALALCRSCHARSACAAWLDSMPKSSQPYGVTAGRVHRTRKTTTNDAGGTDDR